MDLFTTLVVLGFIVFFGLILFKILKKDNTNSDSTVTDGRDRTPGGGGIDQTPQ